MYELRQKLKGYYV